MSILIQRSESLVMINEDDQKLRYKNIVKGSLVLRSKTFDADEGNIQYIEEQGERGEPLVAPQGCMDGVFHGFDPEPETPHHPRERHETQPPQQVEKRI